MSASFQPSDEVQPQEEYGREEERPTPNRQAPAKCPPYAVRLIEAKVKIDGVKYRIDFEELPFEKGALRMAFKGVFRGTGEFDERQCVTKIFLDDAHRSNYQADLKASQMALMFAKKFATHARGLNRSPNPINFIEPHIATVTQVPAGNIFTRPGDKILVEDFIVDYEKYEKFNSNGGWNKGEIAALDAFSHFTYHESQGELLVCDIQGVRTLNNYTLTDPAIHSRTEGAYGLTDLGPVGMSWFFASHRCSDMCSHLLMPERNMRERIGKGKRDRKASSYTFMLSDSEIATNTYYSTRKDLPAIVEEPAVTEEAVVMEKSGNEECKNIKEQGKGLTLLKYLAVFAVGVAVGVVAGATMSPRTVKQLLAVQRLSSFLRR